MEERNVVEFMNFASDPLGLPSYAKVNNSQIRTLRMQMLLATPRFMGAGMAGRDMNVGDPYPARCRLFRHST